MSEHDDWDDNRPENERREPSLKEDSAPDSVGVYERPERSATSPTMLAVIAIMLLLLAAVVVYVLVF
jgi:hypothetical protein